MKTLIVTTFFISSLAFAFPVMAGSGHNHGHSQSQKAISDIEAANRATEVVGELANSKKIDESWIKLKADNIEQKIFSHDPEWVVTFKNEKIQDASKQTLYVFLSLSGDYLGANYTGN